MDINITTDENDAQLLDGFCTSTNWRESSGISKADWINQKVNEYINERITVGMVWSATAAERAALVAANVAARTTATTAITTREITIGGGKLTGGGVTP